MDRLLTVEEVAEVLRVAPWTVRKYLRDGDLRGVKLTARTWRVQQSDLEAFIAARTSEGGPQEK